MLDYLLQQARSSDHTPLVDIAIQDGNITAIQPQIQQLAQQTWDLAGRVVLPALLDLHTHLDKTYLNLVEPTAINQSGTLLDAIQVWNAVKGRQTRQSFERRMRHALAMAVRNGTTALRSHIDIVDEGDLVALEAILAVRESLRDQIDIQIVALGHPGSSPARTDLVRHALSLGVDLVGGAPALTDDPVKEIDAVFALAEATGKSIDLHIDETEDPNMRTLSTLAERTLAHGMQGKVTAGHCCSLAFMQPTSAQQVIEQVAKAQIHIVTLPSCNLVLMGRAMHPTPRGITLVKELLAAGVNVCAASDNVQDPFNPFGSYDLLQIANLNAHVAHMIGMDELYTTLQMVSSHPAKVFGLSTAGIVVGAPADLLVMDAERMLDAVTAIPARLATFKRGKKIEPRV